MLGNNQYTNPFTEEQINFLRKFYDINLSYVKIAELFNKRFNTDKSKSSIREVCTRVIKFPNRVKTPHKLNEIELAFLEANYIGISRAKLTKMFNEQFETNLTESAIKQACNLRGWNNGLTGKFGTREDWVPWNVGISKEEFYSHYDKDAVYKNTRGMIESNIQYHKGDIFMRKGQKFIVVEEPNGKTWMNRVMPLGRYIYEQHYGKIPEGYKVIYKDGNVNNVELSNLLCVNKQTIMELARNDMFGAGELTEATVEISLVKQEIKKYE